jgi:hypothetical protein
VTCKQQEATASRAGFTHDDLVRAGFYEDCRTAATSIRIKHGRLFFLADDGSVDFSTAIRIVDRVLEINESSGGNLEVTYLHSGDDLTIQRVVADRVATPGSDFFADLVTVTATWMSSPFHRQLTAAASPSALGPVAIVSTDYPISFALPPGWSIEANAEEAYFVRPDGVITLSMGTGLPEPGETVADRVRVIQKALFKNCRFDSQNDVSTSVGGEPAIVWNAECGDQADLSLNTIHGHRGYLLTLRAPRSRRDELRAVMDEVLSTLVYTN